MRAEREKRDLSSAGTALGPKADGVDPSLLGGSWVVISRVISPLVGVIIIVTLLITPLITTHEPPSGPCKSNFCLLSAAFQTEPWLLLSPSLSSTKLSPGPSIIAALTSAGSQRIADWV